MIELKKYITSQHQETVNINNELELHFYIDFLLGESFKHSYLTILEKHSSYIGQKELIVDLSKEIYNIVKNNEDTDTISVSKEDLSYYSNIFFDELTIYLYGQTGYQVSKSKYIESKHIFDKVVININEDECKDYKNIVKVLVHEMLHAYNEFSNYIGESKFKLNDLTNKNSSYYKTIFSSKTTIEDICKRICNCIRKWEQNAYISELSVELENNNFDINKYKNSNEAYKEAYELFKKSDVWTQYSVLWTYLNSLNEKGDEKSKLLFQTTYNEINNTSLTFNKIYKKLDALFNKIFKKIERLVPKLFYDYYEEQMNKVVGESLIRQNNAFIEFIDYINNVGLSNRKFKRTKSI